VGGSRGVKFPLMLSVSGTVAAEAPTRGEGGGSFRSLSLSSTGIVSHHCRRSGRRRGGGLGAVHLWVGSMVLAGHLPASRMVLSASRAATPSPPRPPSHLHEWVSKERFRALAAHGRSDGRRAGAWRKPRCSRHRAPAGAGSRGGMSEGIDELGTTSLSDHFPKKKKSARTAV